MTASRTMPDEVLMANVRDNDCRLSFQQLFDRWQHRILRTCFRLTGDWQEGEDVAQDVFSNLHRSRKRYRPTARFSTFLWRITVNHCRDHARKKERQKQRVEKARSRPDPKAVANQRFELADAVKSAIAQLAPEFREVLVLRHYEDLKFREIAKLLEIPPGTVASRMTRALALVTERLQIEGHLRQSNSNPKTIP